METFEETLKDAVLEDDRKALLHSFPSLLCCVCCLLFLALALCRGSDGAGLYVCHASGWHRSYKRETA